MKTAEERSKAFLVEYHELCTKHRVAIYMHHKDLLVAAAAPEDEDGWMTPHVYTETEWQELCTKQRCRSLRREVLTVLHSMWWKAKPFGERTMHELRSHLGPECYGPPDRELLEEVVRQLCRDDLQLWGRKAYVEQS